MSQKERSIIGGEWSCTTPGTATSTSSIALASLLESVDCSCLHQDPANTPIQTISIDSRKCDSTSLFIALCGQEMDGHDFVEQAIASNCAAVLVEKGRLSAAQYQESKACVIEVDDSRKTYATLAETLFNHPASDMTMLAVTGTNGKTTISYLLETVLRAGGKKVGVLGTINYRYFDDAGIQHVIPSPFTTPEPLLLQEILRKMADAGVDHVIMEVSSHGLEQNRIGHLLFDVAAFTNLSRDHLDYHHDMQSYFEAKSILFTEHLRKSGQVVINFPVMKSEWSGKLQSLCLDNSLSLITCGTVNSDIYPASVQRTLQQTEIVLHTKSCEHTICSPLVGDFNVENLQVCFAMAFAAGLELSTICDALGEATGAPGRMQRIASCETEENILPTLFVDYAHTPDALRQVLYTFKQLPHGKLYCVFGCGGDRDSGKRALMGEIAGCYADRVIITDDNPRTEDPATIRDMVAKGVEQTTLPRLDIDCLQEKQNDTNGFFLIPDRKRAIAMAIEAATAQDIVLIAGKGHEDYQITGEGKRFFDDSLEVKKGLCKWKFESLIFATDGRARNGKVSHFSLGSVVTDSRKVQKGDIFVALKGERFDAHDYIEDVVAAGAGCLLLSHEPKSAITAPYIVVADSQDALGDLAAYRRSCMKTISNPTIVGITGSSGKTTVKEMCAAIFQTRFPDKLDKPTGRVLKTEGNFNNLIGLPLSLLPLEPKHRVAVLEMGMNRPGEIEKLTKIADPDIACIVNVHGAHLEGLGTIEGVAAAKGELFRNCRKESVLIVNNDDLRVVELAGKCEQKKITFGFALSGVQTPDISVSTQGKEGIQSENEEIRFVLQIGAQSESVTLHVPGQHNVANAMAAAAIAHAAGAGIKDIAKGLSTFQPAEKRMQILDGPAGSRIINDCYNANPASMKAAIQTLTEIATASSVAVLGDMLELGAGSYQLHKEVGMLAADLSVSFVAVLGEYAEAVAEGVKKSKNAGTEVLQCANQDQCYSWLQKLIQNNQLKAGSYILVKGSRGMHLEKLVEQL